MREGLQESSAHRLAEAGEQNKAEHKEQDRAHIRLHDKLNARTLLKMHRKGARGLQHRADKPGVQHVQDGDIAAMW